MKTKMKKFWVIRSIDDFENSFYVKKNGYLSDLGDCHLFKTKKEATKVAYPDCEVVLKVGVYINEYGDRVIKFI